MKTTGLSSGYLDGTFRPNNNITRAEVAALLYKEASGDTLISVGPTAWQLDSNAPANAYIKYDNSQALLESGTVGINYYDGSIPTLTALHDQQMTAKGAKLCYDAAATAGGSIFSVVVNLNDGTGTPVASVFDNNARTDFACRTYYFSAPHLLDGSDTLSIFVTTSLVHTYDFVTVVSATAIEGFNPTAGVLAPSPSFPGTVPAALP